MDCFKWRNHHIKVGLSPCRKNLLDLFEWKPFKYEKCFLLHHKGLFVLKILNFLSWLFGHLEKTAWLGKVNLKFMTPQPGQQTITVYTLPNIPRSERNQTMKFGQLTEYNKKNIFLQKLCRKCDRETSSRHLFFKKKKKLYTR